MTMVRRALRDNGAIVYMSAVSSTLLLLDHVASGVVSLEIKVSVLWFMSLGVLCPLQCVLVAKRRCSGHWLVQYGAMAAYYLPTPLAFYAVNAVCSNSTSHFDESRIFPLSMGAALSLLFFTLMISLHTEFRSGFTNMRAYSLRDGPHDPWRFVLCVVHLACASWEWTRVSGTSRGTVMQAVYNMNPHLEWSRNNRGLLPLLLNVSPHFLVVYISLNVASNPPESTLDYETKAVAEYMKRESKLRSRFFDDDDDDANSSLQLDCCRYPFMQRRKDEQWISIKDLFQRRDLSEEDQDFWLSFSLCRLLARRYYGFDCAEEGDAKVRRFALADLGRTDGYKRAFTIVEVQLAFLHDYFFTTFLRIMEPRIYILPNKIQTRAAWPSVMCILGMLMLQVAVGQHNNWIPKELITGRYLLSAVTIMICTIYFEITPPLCLLAIYWRPIHIVFHKLYLLDAPTTTIWVRFLNLKHIYRSPNELDVHHPYQTQTSTFYWRDELGQYSVLQDYARRPSRKKALLAWFKGLVQPQPSYRFIKHLPVEEEDVRVPDSVRKLVADTLRAIDGPPTNGTRSLKINMDSAGYDWSWTCRQQTHTDTILIWHIATCYCDMWPLHSDQPEDFPLLVETDTCHEVATTLSRYCAYLVAFLPEFLPEHSLFTKYVFQNVIQDARRALGTTPHMEEKEKHSKIRGLRLQPRRGQTTFHKGVMLGRQLEKINTRLRWKVMAEFWAETILYVAPSENAEAHIEHLAKGGEFVTHLWAMLSNAGILKRATGDWNPPPTTTTKEAPPTKIEETSQAPTQEISTVPSNDEASTSSMSSPQSQSLELTTMENVKLPEILENQ